MPSPAYGPAVAARTRAAEFVRTHPELLASYVAAGGLESDLSAIVAAGRDAEAANLAQSGRQADGKAATLEVTRRFAELQREYKRVMAVVQAVLGDLGRAGADAALLSALEQVLMDETAVTVTLSERDSKRVREVKRTESQEAIRAEILKDAEALLASTGAHEALAHRKVTVERLTALRDGARDLSGQLATRVAKKAERKSATSAEAEAVERQRALWTATQRLLKQVDDPRVDALLRSTRG